MTDISKPAGPIVVTLVDGDTDTWHVDEAPEVTAITAELLGEEATISAYFVVGGFVYEITGWNKALGYFTAFRVAPAPIPLERPEPKAL